jgi:uncharacterized membrane protein
MTEQGNLPTQRVNISTQKMLGGIGSILILLVFMPGTVATLLGIVGVVLWFISIYQLSNILRKPSIFQKVLIGFILNIGSTVIAFAFGLMAGISSLTSIRGETGAIFGLGLGVIVAIIVAYAISLAAFYFYKEAYEILAQATTHNLFKIAGLLMFIGAITIILFGLGLLLIIVGYIVLAVAFFTAPNEVEVQGT